MRICYMYEILKMLQIQILNCFFKKNSIIFVNHMLNIYINVMMKIKCI